MKLVRQKIELRAKGYSKFEKDREKAMCLVRAHLREPGIAVLSMCIIRALAREPGLGSFCLRIIRALVREPGISIVSMQTVK